MRFDVPAPWEVIAYKTDPSDGRLVLADRGGETMRIFWKAPVSDPAPARRLAEAAARHAGGGATEAGIRSRVQALDGWQAYLEPAGDMQGLACRHEPGTGALLYVEFPRHAGTDADILRAVLGSFDANGGGERVWSAFGLEVTLPKDLAPVRVAPFPASQVIRFGNLRGESVTVHRYGMLPLILEGQDEAAYFARLAGPRRMLYRAGAFTQDGRRPGVLLTYTTRGRGGVEALLSRTWQGRVWIWRCDDLGRLYGVDQNAPEGHLLGDLPDRVTVVGAGLPALPDTEQRPTAEAPSDLAGPAAMLRRQLATVPVLNARAGVTRLSDGRVRLDVPPNERPWVRAARLILPLRRGRRVELDALSSSVLDLCDGKRSVGEIIAAHQRRWRLSFYEARGMILEFLRRLTARGIVALVVPQEAGALECAAGGLQGATQSGKERQNAKASDGFGFPV
jgi:hypothetical protein